MKKSMSKKSGKFKQFLISARKKIGPGVTNAPIWVSQKAGKRIWNNRAKRHWREADLGKKFEKSKRKQEQRKKHKKPKSSKRIQQRKKRGIY